MNHAFKSYSRSNNLRARVADYRRMGHEDARNGLGFRREYDTWKEVEQRAYENGRLVATNVASAGFAVPVWRPGVQRMRGFKALSAATVEKVGACIFLTHQPDA